MTIKNRIKRLEMRRGSPSSAMLILLEDGRYLWHEHENLGPLTFPQIRSICKDPRKVFLIWDGNLPPIDIKTKPGINSTSTINQYLEMEEK
jgi:hypothetical protein